MTDTLDLSKPVQTRDGRPVRILCSDRKCAPDDTPEPIVYLVTDEDGVQGYHSCQADGSFLEGKQSSFDLVNVKPSVWHNVYRNGGIGFTNTSREDADADNPQCRIAVLEITANGRAILHTDV